MGRQCCAPTGARWGRVARGDERPQVLRGEPELRFVGLEGAHRFGCGQCSRWRDKLEATGELSRRRRGGELWRGGWCFGRGGRNFFRVRLRWPQGGGCGRGEVWGAGKRRPVAWRETGLRR